MYRYEWFYDGCAIERSLRSSTAPTGGIGPLYLIFMLTSQLNNILFKTALPLALKSCTN